MEQYISKAAIVVEIERWLGEIDRGFPNDHNLGRFDAYKRILSLINTLEVKEVQEKPVSNNYSALLPCIYNRTLEERVKYCKYCSAACEGRVKEPVSDETMTIRKEWFEHCKKSWYNEGYIDGKYNRKSQFEEPVSKVWHDSNKEQPEYGSDVIVLQGYEGDVLHRVVKVNPDRIWAYTNDILSATLQDVK